MIHRDDIPFEEIERIESEIREATGDENARLVFSGDYLAKGVPEDIKKAIEEIEEVGRQSAERGFCVDCFQAMPIYNPWDENWMPDEGWACLSSGKNDDPTGWLCNFCVKEMTGENEEFDENERWTTTGVDPDDLEGDFE